MPNTSTRGSRVAIDTTAGPGHNPNRPQPEPNMRDPMVSLKSIVLFVGISIFLPSNETVEGAVFCRCMMN